LIVGAGPTGLTAAYELRRRGIGCRLIDAAPVRSDKPKGNCLQTRTLEVFDDMNLVGQLLSQGHRALFTTAYVDGELKSRRSYAELDSSYPYVLWLAQVGIEEFMEREVAHHGLKVERELELTSIRPREDGVEVALKRPDGTLEHSEAKWVVACDGAYSTVRTALGLDFSGATYPGVWAMGEAAVDWDLAIVNEYTFFHGLQTPVFCDPMPDGRYRLVTQMSRDDDEKVPEPTLDYFIQRFRDAKVPFRELRDPSYIGKYHIHHRAVQNLRQGRVFLAGDAAHVFSPIAGQGMNCGIQDAYNVAWKLALVIEGLAPDTLLDSYSTERISADAAAMKLSDKETQRYTFHTDYDVDLRRQQFESMASDVGMLVSTFTLSEGAELTTNYRGSPIVEEHPPPNSEHQIQAGDRTPDVVGLQYADGKDARLFDITRTTNHVLLLLAGTEERATIGQLAATAAAIDTRTPIPIDAWICQPGADPPHDPPDGARWCGDPKRELHKRFEADTATVVLIRPDGYIGTRFTLAETEGALAGYLARVFGSGPAEKVERLTSS
jgi:2-polyprenyl-6-methoxyphenol hydroxylase-like FAD-dependent oxidoreductase